jgi:predicted 3-demethylubiquinone-9 3-methyltransferase (glyoxalase superfamily)
MNCNTQEESIIIWKNFPKAGMKKRNSVGWLKDKYAVFWQIVPRVLSELVVTLIQKNHKESSKQCSRWKKSIQKN